MTPEGRNRRRSWRVRPVLTSGTRSSPPVGLAVDAERGEVDPRRSPEDQVGDNLGGRRARAAARPACGRRRRQISESRERDRCRAGVEAARAQARPGRFRPRPRPSPGRAARLVDQVADADGGRAGVEPGVFLGRADQDAAVIARDQVVLAVLDDPREARVGRPQEDDLAFQRRRRDADAEAVEQPPVQAPAATTTHPQGNGPSVVSNGSHMVAGDREPDRGPGAVQPHAALLDSQGKRFQVPRVADLGLGRGDSKQPELTDSGLARRGDNLPRPIVRRRSSSLASAGQAVATGLPLQSNQHRRHRCVGSRCRYQSPRQGSRPLGVQVHAERAAKAPRSDCRSAAQHSAR